MAEGACIAEGSMETLRGAAAVVDAYLGEVRVHA
jgi:ABC-type branched-subunit amino acid transport system ATPase component